MRRVPGVVALLFFWLPAASALPLGSKADERRASYLNAVSACMRGLDDKIAALAASPEARTPEKLSAAADLRVLRQWMEPMPANRDQFRRQFLEATREDPFAQALLASLRHNGTPLGFYDEASPGQCQGSQMAYFTPGAYRKEVGMCLKHNDLMGRSVVGFIHESLHLYQFSKGPVKNLLSYDFHGTKRISERALGYTPHPRYMEIDDAFATRGHDLILALPPVLQAQVSYVLWSLDGMKTLFLIYPKGEDGIEFVPKKPWVIPEEKFYQALEEKLAGGAKLESESADLRFRLDLAPARARQRAKEDREVARLSESWHDWLRLHPSYRSRSRKEQLDAYLKELGAQYQSLLRSVAKDRVLRRKLDDLFQMFFVSSRIMRGLLNFCAEMQANMQSRMLLYLFYQKIHDVPGCGTIQPAVWEGRADLETTENIFSSSFAYSGDFDKVDAAIERWTRRFISKTQSYGPSFSFLYGYESFPQIFNPESCGHFKEEYVSFRPQ